MCGICGIWGQAREAEIRGMMDRLAHRGPDAQGMHAGAAGRLGHRRLSIMDPEGGNQPIYSGDRERAIVANGEIYNFPALREELGAAHTFRTRSDTESALHLYEDLAQDAAGRLDGMFAFAIADGDTLYAARDPVGIKPLYLGRRGEDVIFSSELKALVGVADAAEEFPPGSWYHSRLGARKYRPLPKRSPQERPADDHARRLREALARAVTKRLMSDVPVGAFLSGGLDSSLICALIRPQVDALHTFSVGLEGSADLQAARVVARHLDTIHHEYILDGDEIAAKLPEIVWSLESYDRDLVRSAVPCYFTSRLAARHVKVILTGEGADELFAGYTYYRDISDTDRLPDELYRSVCSLHNVNLQRVDRLTMAHGLEGRVPLLDEELIALAQTIPHNLKLREAADGTRVEKWILRKACEDLLPAEIVWRDKEQFDEGSGAKDVLARGLQQYVPAEDAEAYAARFPAARLRSAEECAYHKLLCEAYDNSPLVLDNVARWSDRPDELGLDGEHRVEPMGSGT